MNGTRKFMAILLSVVMLLSSMPLGVLAETFGGEEHDHSGEAAVAPVSGLVDPADCEHVNVEWSDKTNISLEYLRDPAYNEPYSESKHLYTGPVTRTGFCLNCESSMTRDEENPEPYYASHSFGLDGLCTLCGHDPVCDHANANWFDEDPSAADAANPDYYEQLSETQHRYVGPTTQVGICPDCDCQAKRNVENTSIADSHSYGEDGSTCVLCGYAAVCTHPDMYMVNWDASTEDLGLAKNYVQKDAEHHTYVGPATLSLYCDDCGLHKDEFVESASIDMSHDLAITTVCGYCGYDSKPAATDTPEPTATAAVTPAPTATVSPDATPLPDPTQQPEPTSTSCAHLINPRFTRVEAENKDRYNPSNYSEYDSSRHYYNGPGYLCGECLDCGAELRVYSEHTGLAEYHMFVDNGLCVMCGASPADYCTHANAEYSDPVIDAADAAKPEYYSVISADSHLYTGPATQSAVCPCGAKLIRTLESAAVELEHTFGDDGACTLCGYVQCSHASLDWTGAEYTVSIPEEFANDASRFAPLDGSLHTYTGPADLCALCPDCGVSVRIREEERTIRLAHSLTDGECALCGYIFVCSHANVEWREIPDPNNVLLGKFTAEDEAFHSYTGPAIKTGDCPDCGESLRESLNETAALTNLPHTFVKGICSDCGYQNSCLHPETRTVTSEWTQTGCQRTGDLRTHRKTFSYTVTSLCADCGEELGVLDVNNVDVYEEHIMTGHFCSVCNYSCQHQNCTTEFTAIRGEYSVKDAASHIFTGDFNITKNCTLCVNEVYNVDRLDQTYVLPHDFDTDGVCRTCGYAAECTHPNAERTLLPDPHASVSAASLDAFRHHYEGPAVLSIRCGDCGADFVLPSDETISGDFDHEYLSNRCVRCGYTKTCLHPEEALENRIVPASNTRIRIESDTHHSFEGYCNFQTVCTQCGDYLKEYRRYEVDLEERHDFSDSGVCSVCGYENTCEHISFGPEVQFDASRADEIICEIHSADRHSLTGPGRLTGHCNYCGTDVDVTGEFTVFEEHQFDENGICTACSYFTVCAHPAESRYENFRPLPEGSFAPSTDGSFHVYTGPYDVETLCLECGRIVSVEHFESGSRSLNHSFRNGFCTDCGQEGVCEHNRTFSTVENQLIGKAVFGDNNYHTAVVNRYRITACLDCEEILETRLIEANVSKTLPHRDNGSGYCADCSHTFACSHIEAYAELRTDSGTAAFTPYDDRYHQVSGRLVVSTYCPTCMQYIGEETEYSSEAAILEIHDLDSRNVCKDCGYKLQNGCLHKHVQSENRIIASWCDYVDEENHLAHGYNYTLTLCQDCGVIVKSQLNDHFITRLEPHSYSGSVCTGCYDANGCTHYYNQTESYYAILQLAPGITDSYHTVYAGSYSFRKCVSCSKEFGAEIGDVFTIRLEHEFDESGVCIICGYSHNIPVQSISVGSKLTLGVGTTHQLSPTLRPANTTDDITYSSSKTSVAAVDEYGMITAKKTGTAVITVRCGSKSAKVTVTVKKAPSSIKLSPAAATLGVGQSGTLKYTLSSGSAGTVTFVSSNPAVATVDANGKVTAVGVGAATITAATQNGKKAKSTITVKPAPEKITLNETAITLGEKQTFTLKASVNEGSLGTITFQSLNPAVACVTSGGVITAKRAGTATIVARAQNGVAASCTVTVKPGPSCVTVADNQLILGVKQTYRIGYVLGVEGEDCMGSVTFSSSKPKVASVDASGKITALRTGTTVITLTTQNDRTARVTVTVKKAPSSIKLSPTTATLGVGDTGTLKYTLTSGSAAAVAFTSGNESIATVDANGKITAVAPGSVTITAKTHNGRKATCKLTVKEAPSSIALSRTEMVLGVQQTASISGSVNEGSAGKVHFESLNPEFATISGGKITAEAVGTATLRAWTHNGVEAFCTVVVKPAPSCVTVSKDQLILGVKQTHRIEYVLGVEGEDCMGSVTFSSSKPKVASVDANGKISALRTGTTVITLTTQNDRTARVTVTVKKAPSSIKLSPTTATLGVGDTGTLKYTLTSGSAAAVAFTSGNESIATVDANGVVTAVSVGKVTITAKTHNGRKATCKLTVKAAPTSIELNRSELTLTYGESFDLNHTLSANSHSNVRYAISGDAGITVDASGVVKVTEMCPVERHAVVTASTHVEGVTAQCAITVPADPKEVHITSVPELGVKMTGYLTAVTDTAGSVTFHCDANEYFTLAANGKITAKKAGTAMVYAKTFNGVVSEPVAVTIHPAPSKVVIPATLTLGVGETYRFAPEFGSDNEIGAVSFKSSRSATASINADGTLTAKKAGSVTITVTTHNGRKDTCKVTIR